jgi:hypothetical protein
MYHIVSLAEEGADGIENVACLCAAPRIAGSTWAWAHLPRTAESGLALRAD